jgi:hypothetical protein
MKIVLNFEIQFIHISVNIFQIKDLFDLPLYPPLYCLILNLCIRSKDNQTINLIQWLNLVFNKYLPINYSFFMHELNGT